MSTTTGNFEARRVEHYSALRKLLDATVFIDQLQGEMRAELDGPGLALDSALPKLDVGLDIRDRGNNGSSLGF